MEGAGEVATKIYSGGTPKTGITEYWDNGTIPWMSSGEF
jgi:type I restriction enzyme S subunit